MAEKKPGKKLLNNQVIRFVLSAGAGFLVDVSAYYLFYHNLLTQKRYHIFFLTLKNSTVSLALSFFLGVMVNFVITRYFVFSESTSSPQKQFFRFVSVAILGFFANLGVLELLIKALQMYPPVARPTAALSLFFASFFVHKFFSFSLKRKRHAPGDHRPAEDNA
jgi:putative flippase GtrA